MLSFLSPAALIGLSLLAIPIVIHLLKPRKVRRTPFSSLRWLHLTQQRLSRRLRWHQLLLFALRAAFIALLVFVVAKPIFDSSGTAGPSERFVILDTSRSMGYQVGQQPTPLDAGKQAAATLLAGGGADDRTTLLTVGETTKILGPPARDAQRYIAKLSTLKAEPTDTDLGSALDTVRALLARDRSNARIELFFITDSHRGSWRPGTIESFVAEYPDRVAATIVNAAPAGATNGWVATAEYLPAEGNFPAAVDLQLRAVGAAAERTVRLTGTGLTERSQTVMLDPDQPLDIRFELPAEFDPRGKTCEVVLDPPDALPSDDRWYVAFDSGASLDVLVVEGRSPTAGGAAPGFALRTAIEALSSSNEPIRVVSKKFNDLETADLAAVDVILLADVPELSSEVVEKLAERVRNGLGLGIFLGPGVEPNFYNQRMIDPLDRAKSLLPLPLDRAADVPLDEGGLAPLESVAWNHPLLAGLFDPEQGDLAKAQSRSYYRFAAPSDATSTTLATVDGTPAIVERNVGRGKVVLFNATADDTWSDFPRLKSFVPLVDRLLNYLSGGSRQRSFTTGEAITLALPAAAEGETFSIVAPGGETLTPTVDKVGTGVQLRLAPQATPGVYQVRRHVPGDSGAAETTFVVQVGRGDSAIEPLDADTLRAWWQPATCELTTVATVGTQSSAVATSLVAWMAALAALMLLLETFFVHRLCPRMNPKVAESMVQRRPIVSKSFGARAPLPEVGPLSMPAQEG